MIINNLKIKDIEKILPLCEEHFYAVKMDERGYSYDVATARKTLKQILKNKLNLALIDENCSGIIVFNLYLSPFNETDIVASEFLWYARTSKLAICLFEKVMWKLKDLSIKNIAVGIPFDKKVINFLERKGFHPTETIYRKLGD